MAKDDSVIVSSGVKTPKEKASNAGVAAAVIARWSALEASRNYWMSMWQNLATYVMPRKSYILNKQIGPNLDRETQLFDTTAVRANQIMAAGIMSYVNDPHSNWVQLSAPEYLEEEEGVAEYFAECTEIILEELGRSNFYNTIHESHLDRGAFGTTAVFVDEGETSPLLFKTFDVGSFCASENHEGYVDTVLVKREMSVRQLVEAYGIENVSDAVCKMYESGDGKNFDTKVEVVWEIRPRSEKERAKGKIDGPNKPFASIHIECATKHVLRNSGFDEQPVFVSRFLKWQDSVYGWSPAWVALPDAKQLNFLQKQLDALAELAAFPRILVPEDMNGEPDLRAGGITYFDAKDPNAVPREWATNGRYDIGLDRVKMKQAHIEEAFNVPLFQMFAQEEAQRGGTPITATQVRAMESEKLVLISPTYSRLTTELLIPIVKRVYGILARRGMLPPPPQSLIQLAPNGEPFIPEPQVIFNNRMSIAVGTRSVQIIDEVVAGAVQLSSATGDMSPLDNFNFDKIVREKTLANGGDPDFLRDPQEIAQIRQGRSQQAQQQAAMQQQTHQADIAQKLGSVRPDTAAGAQLNRMTM
jgi:hypothetical protein